MSDSIQCPYCRCTPEKGFDCIGHDETDDRHIRDVYECPDCKKISKRCYVFYAYADQDNEIIEMVDGD